MLVRIAWLEIHVRGVKAMRLRAVLPIFTICVVAFVWARALGVSAGEAPPVEIVPQLGHFNKVTSVAISPDGKTALSGGRDTTLKLWDLATGLEIRAFEGHSEEIISAAISPDGKTALSDSKYKDLNCEQIQKKLRPTTIIYNTKLALVWRLLEQWLELTQLLRQALSLSMI